MFRDGNVYTPANNNDVINNGTTVKIELTVQKNDDSTNKTIVETTMTSGGYASGMLLDVDMTKIVTSSSGELTNKSPVTAVNNLIPLNYPSAGRVAG